RHGRVLRLRRAAGAGPGHPGAPGERGQAGAHAGAARRAQPREHRLARAARRERRGGGRRADHHRRRSGARVAQPLPVARRAARALRPRVERQAPGREDRQAGDVGRRSREAGGGARRDRGAALGAAAGGRGGRAARDAGARARGRHAALVRAALVAQARLDPRLPVGAAGAGDGDAAGGISRAAAAGGAHRRGAVRQVRAGGGGARRRGGDHGDAANRSASHRAGGLRGVPEVLRRGGRGGGAGAGRRRRSGGQSGGALVRQIAAVGILFAASCAHTGATRPNAPEPAANAGWALLADGKTAPARDAFERVIEKDGGDLRALYGRAVIAQETGDLARAQQLWMQLLHAGIGSPDEDWPRLALAAARRLDNLIGEVPGERERIEGELARLDADQLPEAAARRLLAVRGRYARRYGKEAEARALDRRRGCPDRWFVAGPYGKFPRLDLGKPFAPDEAKDA